MRRLLFPVLTALCLCASAASAGDPPLAASGAPASSCLPATPTAAQAVTCVQQVYDQSQTFASDFSQKFWVKAYNQEKSSHGHVQFAKPGKMHWTYDDPQSTGNRVVSDGVTLGARVRWRDIEVAREPSGKPTLHLEGVAREFGERLGVKNISLTITHSGNLALAEVIFEN